MASNRRKFLTVGSAVAALGTAGCARDPRTLLRTERGPTFLAGWEFQSDESIHRHSPLRNPRAPDISFASVVGTEADAATIRWAYLEEISADFVTHFANVDFTAGEFLTHVEVLLPRSHELERSGTTFRGESVSMTYDVVSTGIESKELWIANSLQKWTVRGSEPPSDVELTVKYTR